MFDGLVHYHICDKNHVYLIFAITVFLDNIEREFSTQYITLIPSH